MKGYTTLEKVKAYSGMDILSEYESTVTGFIEGVEEYIDNYTGRDFTVAAEDAVESTRVFDGDGSDELYVGPVKDISSVILYGGGTAIDAAQYVGNPANTDIKDRVKLRYLVFPCGTQNISITGVWGLATAKKDIEFVATVMVAGIIFNQRAKTDPEIQSMTVGRYSVSYKTTQEKSALDTVNDTLDFNKRYTF